MMMGSWRRPVVIGLNEDGSRSPYYWERLDEINGWRQSLKTACPDLGTEICLSCAHGDDKACHPCDFECRRCTSRTVIKAAQDAGYEVVVCPCSMVGWMKRMKESDEKEVA